MHDGYAGTGTGEERVRGGGPAHISVRGRRAGGGAGASFVVRGRSVLMWSVADILVRCPFPGRVGRVVFGCSEFAVTTDVCVCV